MEQYILNINPKRKEAAQLLEFLKTLNFIQIEKSEKPSNLLQSAVTDVKQKNTKKMDGKDDFSKLMEDVEK